MEIDTAPERWPRHGVVELHMNSGRHMKGRLLTSIRASKAQPEPNLGSQPLLNNQASGGQEWLDAERLRQAAEYVLAGMPIKEIAFELGFTHSSHFIRKFRSHYHRTPMSFADAWQTTASALPAIASSPSNKARLQL